MSDVSAHADQKITITVPMDAPMRLINHPRKMYSSLREITLSTEEAVDLCEQLRHALYD